MYAPDGGQEPVVSTECSERRQSPKNFLRKTEAFSNHNRRRFNRYGRNRRRMRRLPRDVEDLRSVSGILVREVTQDHFTLVHILSLGLFPFRCRPFQTSFFRFGGRRNGTSPPVLRPLFPCLMGKRISFHHRRFLSPHGRQVSELFDGEASSTEEDLSPLSVVNRAFSRIGETTNLRIEKAPSRMMVDNGPVFGLFPAVLSWWSGDPGTIRLLPEISVFMQWAIGIPES